MSVCAAPTCSHQSFDGSSYYVDVDVDQPSWFNQYSDHISTVAYLIIISPHRSVLSDVIHIFSHAPFLSICSY